MKISGIQAWPLSSQLFSSLDQLLNMFKLKQRPQSLSLTIITYTVQF